MAIASRIRNAAVRNSELLLVLSDTRDAARDLEQQKGLVGRIDGNLSDLCARITKLDEKRELDLKKHKSYRDSVVKKFVYRLSGQSDMFAARAQKEQREYFDILQQEQKVKEEQDRLRAEKDEAVAIQRRLEDVVERRSRAQDELDALYDSIFHGPNPEFPEEDELEKKAEQALNTYHCAAVRLEKDAKLTDILTAARDTAGQALKDTMEALSGGHLASSTIEKKKLGDANIKLKQMQELVAHAQKISAKVIPLPVVNINIKLLDREAYTNPFGRMALHDIIREWRSGIQVCLAELDKQLSAATLVNNEQQQSVKVKAETLIAAREALQSCRSGIFVIVESAEFNKDEGECPPPY